MREMEERRGKQKECKKKTLSFMTPYKRRF